MVAGIKSERRPASNRNPRPECVGIRNPEGMEQARPLMDNVEFAASAYAAIEGADALVLVTEWDAFRALDLHKVKALLKSPVVVDLRNVYAPDEMRRLGFSYTSVGRYYK